MKIVSISDLHILQNNDDADQLLVEFFKRIETKEADIVCFLGDIFDTMVGNKKQYIKKYTNFFEGLKECILRGQKVYYLEGNHDFHLGAVFDYFVKKNNLNSELFVYSNQPLIIKDGDKKYMIGHGDDIELDNPGYDKWKSIYTSKWFKFLVDYILPFFFINYLGYRASKKL
jgi:UDP-2,3-diacylglucosamine hydrolase